jgi:hypothetical protein
VSPQISLGQLLIYSLLLPAVMSLEKSLELMGPITPNQLSVISYQWVSYQLSNSKMENVFVIEKIGSKTSP